MKQGCPKVRDNLEKFSKKCEKKRLVESGAQIQTIQSANHGKLTVIVFYECWKPSRERCSISTDTSYEIILAVIKTPSIFNAIEALTRCLISYCRRNVV